MTGAPRQMTRYEELAEDIAQSIHAGVLRLGDRLPRCARPARAGA